MQFWDDIYIYVTVDIVSFQEFGLTSFFHARLLRGWHSPHCSRLHLSPFFFSPQAFRLFPQVLRLPSKCFICTRFWF